ARLENREFLNAEINAVFSSKPRDEVRALLKNAQIAFGAVNTIADVSNHPALRKIPTLTPAGSIEVMAPPAHVVGEDIEALSVPVIGQHSDALRAEFS
ncbi:MAG: CoA transferase, partial [Burkholderiaceae bacterium]